jgi:hypothetical protein
MGNEEMFKILSPEEEQQFRAWAIKNDPPQIADWEAYHPVCRDEWIKRGIKP